MKIILISLFTIQPLAAHKGIQEDIENYCRNHPEYDYERVEDCIGAINIEISKNLREVKQYIDDKNIVIK